MKIVVKIISALVVIVLVFVGNNFIMYVLPRPINYINFTLIFLIWLIIYRNNLQSFWYGLALGFIDELYSTSAYGILLIATILTLILVSWLLLNIFTNRSIFIVFFSGIVGLASFKIIFLTLNLFANLLSGRPWSFQLLNISESIWVILMSSIALTIFYLLSSLFITRFKPEFLNSKGSRYEFH